MNTKQLRGAYTTLVTLLLVVFSHSPWSGYRTTSYDEFTKSFVDLPLWEWQTIAPLVPWLGLLQNLTASVVLIALLALIWVIANRHDVNPTTGAKPNN
jgi:hypothetical protein